MLKVKLMERNDDRFVDSESLIPAREIDGDAGFSLFADIAEDLIVGNGCVVKIPTGLKFEIPEDRYLEVKNRSSMGSKGWSLACGVIDNGYRGELIMILRWSQVDPSDQRTEAVVRGGDKIGQFVLRDMPISGGNRLSRAWRRLKRSFQNDEIVVVNEIDTNTERGASGFGSTGTRSIREGDFEMKYG